MYFLLFTALLLALIAFLAFIRPLKVDFAFDSVSMDMRLRSTWLSFLAFKVEKLKPQPKISFYIFKRKIASHILRKKKKIDFKKIKAVCIQDSSGRVMYGLNEPYRLGLIIGAVASLAALFGIKSLEQYPDFLSREEYINITAKVKINIGKTLANILMLKSKAKQRSQNVDYTSMNENVDYLFRSLENFTQNEGIIGKPVTQGDKTFLPVVSITVGYGGGNANMGKNGQDSSASYKGAAPTGAGSGALGVGAKLCTDAIILIDNQNVSLLSMSSNASALMDKIPQVISSISQSKQSGQTQQG